MIDEGANGIQALDLVGSKIGKNAGRALMAFLGEIYGYVCARIADAAIAKLPKANAPRPA